MNRTTRHISLSVILTAATVLSSCQNRNNGINGSNNWNRNAYANKVLSQPRNSTYFALNGSQVLGYITQGSAGVVPGVSAGGVQAGGVVRGPGATGQGTAGGIVGGSIPASLGAACSFKMAAVSPTAYLQGSTQNFGYGLNESNYPSSGRGVYQLGNSYPVNCGPDSEVAATKNTFYVTSGASGQNIFVFRVSSTGAVIGSSAIPSNGPTKIAASPTGHIAVVENGGRTLRFFMETGIGGDGSFIPREVANMPILGNQFVKDVVIDAKQGGMYVAQQLPGGGRSIKVYGLQAAFQGIFQSFYDSQSAFGANMGPQFRNISYNMDEATTANIFNVGASPVAIKNFDGLTGILLSTGKPFFLETQLSKPSSEISGAAPQITNPSDAQQRADAQQYYQNVADDGVVSAIYAYDPFQVGFNNGSPYTQAGFRFLDIAVGDNFMYGISQGSVYSCFVGKDYQYDCATPRQISVSYLGQLRHIDMSPDQTFAYVSGSGGLSIGNRIGNYLTFSPVGRADIIDNVIHAAALAKDTSAPVVPVTSSVSTTDNSSTPITQN